jgi:hypothetical protein
MIGCGPRVIPLSRPTSSGKPWPFLLHQTHSVTSFSCPIDKNLTHSVRLSSHRRVYNRAHSGPVNTPAKVRKEEWPAITGKPENDVNILSDGTIRASVLNQFMPT